jgi:NAD(P)-dependent dehydrogenase (short-subunit alcohol dehydrogenase family)
MSMDVKDQIALVTGANRGIGKAITISLLSHGATKVYAAVRSPDSASEMVDEYGDRIVPIEFDLTRKETIDAAAEVANDVSLVVNNAGVLRTVSALDPNAVENLQAEMETNVYGLIYTAQAFAPVLKANGGGAFVQLNSVASMKSFPDIATYSASKAAAYSITQALRIQLGKQGTVVLSVHPGPIATDMGDAAGFTDFAEPPELVGEAIVEALAAGDSHVYPDTLAKKVGSVYRLFVENVIDHQPARE